MPRSTLLQEEEKGSILAFSKSGLNVSQISREIGRSRTVIANFLKDPENYGKKRSSGRKEILSARDKRRIIKKASNSTASCSQLAALSSKKVSAMTVWRTLNKSGCIVRGVLKKIPKLTQLHKTARINFALNNLETCWDQVIFSDEKKFNLDGPDGFRHYWRDLRKEPLYFSKRNFGGSSVMVWGAFNKFGTLDLQFTSSRMNSTEYIRVLESSLLPFLNNNREKPYIFMQDNARIHTSRQTRAFLRDCSVEVMDWPACSPDLNPIENIWGILVRRLYKENKKYDNVNDLKTSILYEWSQLEPELLKKLANSMKKRLFDVGRVQGSVINY